MFILAGIIVVPKRQFCHKILTIFKACVKIKGADIKTALIDSFLGSFLSFLVEREYGSMISVVINMAAVVAGGTAGLFFGRRFPKRVADTVMVGLALCVLYIGISGALGGQNTLITILSVALGGMLGELMDIDGGLNKLGQKLEAKLGGVFGGSPLAEGFVSASMLFCVGAMAIVGSLQSGLAGDHSTIIAKSVIDGIAAVLLASSLGAGVLFAALAVGVYQGAIVLLAECLQPLLSDAVVAEMSCAGSLLIIGLAFNMLNVTKIKVANYIPAIFLPIILCRFM